MTTSGHRGGSRVPTAAIREGTCSTRYAIYGYEAMRLALDAIERSGTGEKADIIDALFATEDRESVLGTYSIDDNGDTTLTDYGVYSIRRGELVFDQTIHAAPVE